MKKIIFALAILASIQNASAWGMAWLVDCEYRYLPDFGRSAYVGLYKSQSGTLYSYTFRTYCPQTISL